MRISHKIQCGVAFPAALITASNLRGMLLIILGIFQYNLQCVDFMD